MSRYHRTSYTRIGFGGPLTPAVKMLIVACVIAFVIQIIDQLAGTASLTSIFGLTPWRVWNQFYAWQVGTYMFLHRDPFHLLINMLGLWMFGSQLEETWGRSRFLRFYLVCGIGAGLLTVMLQPSSSAIIIGASGAIYGILLAFGLLFPNQPIWLMGMVPIAAKYFVMIFGAIALLTSLQGSNSGVAHLTHLAGLAVGFLYLRGGRLVPDLKWRYQAWKRERLRRKFEVYYNERRREDEDRSSRWKN